MPILVEGYDDPIVVDHPDYFRLVHGDMVRHLTYIEIDGDMYPAFKIGSIVRLLADTINGTPGDSLTGYRDKNPLNLRRDNLFMVGDEDEGTADQLPSYLKETL